MDFEVKEMKEYLFGKKYLPHRSMIALVLGIVAGLLFYDFAVWVEPFGTAFMNFDQNVDRTGSSFQYCQWHCSHW